MMQQASDPLAQLRDIHVPGMIEAWPPAPGWWILATLGALLVIAGLTWLFRYWRANRYRREAMSELAQLLENQHQDEDDQAYLEALQRLLKRAALTCFPREEVASLTGEAWVQFLDRTSGSHDFSIGEAEALIDGTYRPDISVDVESLHLVAKSWIRKHHPRHLEAEKQRLDDLPLNRSGQVT
tara:strand:+ start:526 stop:1074 length:549 start_codon:yes stop_codon:yes gene_type:complete